MPARRRVAFWLAAGLTCASAQEAGTRAAQIEQAREEKEKVLEPEKLSRIEGGLLRVNENKIYERFIEGIAGVRVKLGGMVTGSGFGFGPEFFRNTWADGKVVARASARLSTRLYQHYDAQLTLPKLSGGRMKLDLLAAYRNMPRTNYYGPGPHSAKTGRSNYRFEDTSCDVTLTARSHKRLQLGLTGGYVAINTGPGTDRRFASAEQVYTPAQAPGIDVQSDFLRGGFFVQYDYRDFPAGARSGGNYLAKLMYYGDRTLGLHTHKQLHLEAQQFIPFFNQRRVIALRGKSLLTYSNPGQTVPFYLQPTIGGGSDLRGYRNFRFQDDNNMVMNAEYRWEVFSGLDMAIFADAGKVFHRVDTWGKGKLESDVGFGFRFNVRNTPFMRIDFGFSQEGFRIWFKFDGMY